MLETRRVGGGLMVSKQDLAGQPAELHTRDSSVRNVTSFTFTQASAAGTVSMCVVWSARGGRGACL